MADDISKYLTTLFFNRAKVHMQIKEGRKAVGKKHATLF